MKCKKEGCGADLGPDAQFCSDCGTKVTTPTLIKSAICPSCNNFVLEVHKFCLKCGTPVDPALFTDKVCSGTKKDGGKCNTALASGANFCPSCGMSTLQAELVGVQLSENDGRSKDGMASTGSHQEVPMSSDSESVFTKKENLELISSEDDIKENNGKQLKRKAKGKEKADSTKKEEETELCKLFEEINLTDKLTNETRAQNTQDIKEQPKKESSVDQQTEEKEDKSNDSTELDKKEDNPNDSTELDKKEDTPNDSTELDKKGDKPNDRTGLDKKEDKPNDSTELDKKEDKPNYSTELDKKEDNPNDSTELDKKEDNSNDSTELDKKEDKPNDSTELDKGREKITQDLLQVLEREKETSAVKPPY